MHLNDSTSGVEGSQMLTVGIPLDMGATDWDLDLHSR